MAIIAFISILIGALLALRWNVLVLVPAIGAAVPLVVLIGVARGEGAGLLAVDVMVAATCIEVGYIARPVVRVLMDATRAAITAATINKGVNRLKAVPGTALSGHGARGANSL
jgi:hypothetical protein